jgi:hypothetical protein
MTPEDWLPALLSKDSDRIWRTCGAIRRSWDRAALCALAGESARIEAATKGVDLGGMLRPNALQLSFALRKLSLAGTDACFCSLYRLDDLFDPTQEAEAGHVALSDAVVDMVNQEAHWTCTCRACGARFRATEVMGYHYPWYRWIPH